MVLWIFFSKLIVILLFLAFAPPRHFAKESSTSIPFSYQGTTGPTNWGKLNPNFSRCSNGKFQSPINILRNQTFINTNLKPLLRSYRPANATLITRGFNVGILFQSDCGAVNLNNKKYALKQMHWHAPSEHRIDGVQYPLELHLVHQLEDGTYSVIAVLYQYGDADPFIAKVQKALDKLAEEVKNGNKEAQVPLGMFNAKLLKRRSQRYLRYFGSLTTPPCTENVIWNILLKVRTVSKKQVEELKAPLEKADKNNCRPVQPLNGRRVEIAPRAH